MKLNLSQSYASHAIPPLRQLEILGVNSSFYVWLYCSNINHPWESFTVYSCISTLRINPKISMIIRSICQIKREVIIWIRVLIKPIQIEFFLIKLYVSARITAVDISDYGWYWRSRLRKSSLFGYTSILTYNNLRVCLSSNV